MTTWMHGSFPGHEVNLVFARGMALDALTRSLREARREPLAHGEAGGWAWAVHDMHNYEAEDYEDVDYRGLSGEGAEIVVFETEPCSAKAHPPSFGYFRDGRSILHFAFGDQQQRVGENPDHLSLELLAANLIGPGSECPREADVDHDCFDHHYEDHARLVKVIAGFFLLPTPPLSAEVAAR
ncbi:hypothetical protein [Actinacidiphila glaucinigra]|uniref:hypothetical protein n=1 Tax=Actinacidiphila glaucinigra TaxID=235986 RepID=UPI00366E8E30